MNQITLAKEVGEFLRVSLVVTGTTSIIHSVNPRAVFLSNLSAYVPFLLASPIHTYIEGMRGDPSFSGQRIWSYHDYVSTISLLSSLYIRKRVGQAVDKDFNSLKIIATSLAITFIYVGTLNYLEIAPFDEE